MDRVIYDGQCPMCRSLAHYLGRRGLIYESREDFCKKNPSLNYCRENQGFELATWNGEQLFVGNAAWQRLLNQEPTLKELNWLATKLNLIPSVSKALRFVGHAARRLCRRCPS